jgi:hypothetical protein
MSNDNATNYSNMVKNVGSAIQLGDKAEGQWVKAGALAREFFGSAEALSDIKAQFIADAIAPYCKPHHLKAMEVELPRMNGKEYAKKVAENATYVQFWQTANQAKKDARSTFDGMFSRVLKYAFPAVKKDEPAEPAKSEETIDLERLVALIGRLEKAQGRSFDIPAVLGFLNQAKTTMAKTIL